MTEEGSTEGSQGDTIKQAAEGIIAEIIGDGTISRPELWRKILAEADRLENKTGGNVNKANIAAALRKRASGIQAAYEKVHTQQSVTDLLGSDLSIREKTVVDNWRRRQPGIVNPNSKLQQEPLRDPKQKK